MTEESQKDLPVNTEEPPRTLREKVEIIEKALHQVAQVECPIRHYFAPGLFAREITIPEGTVIVGAVHSVDNIVVLSKGTLRLVTEDGPIDISAPHTRMCKAGSKNAAIALETAVWTNFFPNPDDEQEIEVLVERYTESKASDLLGGSTNKQLEANKAAEIAAAASKQIKES